MTAPAWFRASTPVFRVAGGLAAALIAALVHVAIAPGEAARLEGERALVEALDLTDLVLFTEARYGRHRSQADLHSAFQDGPMLAEHFPAGSMVPPARGFPPAGFADGEGE